MHPILRILLLLLLTATVAGCGVRTAYNNLDRLALRWVDNRVSLDGEQKRAVQHLIQHQLDWHCASELPDYADWLRQVEADVEGDRITVALMRGHAETIAAFGQRLLASATPSVVEVLSQLDDSQVERLAESFDERNLELAEQAAMDGDERRTQQVQAMTRGLRRFLGRPDGDQRQRLEQWATELIRSDESTMSQRLRWQQAFFDALEMRHQPGFDEVVEPLLVPGDGWSPEYIELMEHNRERTLEALVDLHHMASDRQINRLRSRLTSLADDFERLACR